MWWEILEATLLKSEMRQGCQIPPLLFSIVLQFPTKAIRRKMEVNENRGRLCRKKLQGKIRKKKNHQKEKDITGSVKRANHNKGSMIVSDPTELVQPGGNNHSSRFVRLCVGACFIHGAGWHTLHSLSASGKRDSEKRKIIWKPVKAPLGIGAKERGIASSV